eukprot:PhM_4_TR16355/c0_g1_i1/m.81829
MFSSSFMAVAANTTNNNNNNNNNSNSSTVFLSREPIDDLPTHPPWRHFLHHVDPSARLRRITRLPVYLCQLFLAIERCRTNPAAGVELVRVLIIIIDQWISSVFRNPVLVEKVADAGLVPAFEISQLVSRWRALVAAVAEAHPTTIATRASAELRQPLYASAIGISNRIHNLSPQSAEVKAVTRYGARFRVQAWVSTRWVIPMLIHVASLVLFVACWAELQAMNCGGENSKDDNKKVDSVIASMIFPGMILSMVAIALAVHNIRFLRSEIRTNAQESTVLLDALWRYARIAGEGATPSFGTENMMSCVALRGCRVGAAAAATPTPEILQNGGHHNASSVSSTASVNMNFVPTSSVRSNNPLNAAVQSSTSNNNNNNSNNNNSSSRVNS